MSPKRQFHANGRERPDLWDPASAWPAGRKWIWAVLAGFVVIAQGPTSLKDLRVTWEEGNDFFQDWASARNVQEGRPAYLPLAESVARHVPTVAGSRSPTAHLPWNAHPPTSILVTLPLAGLDYPQAGTAWNVLCLAALAASLGLIARELNFPVPAWSILPIAALGLLCSPIRTQISQGQWNAPLLLLLTLAWVALRRGRDSWAGFCVGTAITLKLFPVFFLLDFAIQRRWRALFGGCLWAFAGILATIAVLGLDAFRDYDNRVLPTLHAFRSGWANVSIPAFWAKNFASGASHYGLYIEPVIRAPFMASVGTVLSYGFVLAATFFFVNRSIGENALRCQDLCTCLTIVTMLLLAPICWDHYLLLLALPLAMIWSRLGGGSFQRLAFLLLVAAVWLGPSVLWRAGGVDLQSGWPDFHEVPAGTYVIHRPFFVPVFLSLHTYALVACYVWLVLLARRDLAEAGPARDNSRLTA
jgi:hypothetical protein